MNGRMSVQRGAQGVHDGACGRSWDGAGWEQAARQSHGRVPLVPLLLTIAALPEWRVLRLWSERPVLGEGLVALTLAADSAGGQALVRRFKGETRGPLGGWRTSAALESSVRQCRSDRYYRS